MHPGLVNLEFRIHFSLCGYGGIGRRARLRIWYPTMCRFDPCYPHTKTAPLCFVAQRGGFLLWKGTAWFKARPAGDVGRNPAKENLPWGGQSVLFPGNCIIPVQRIHLPSQEHRFSW